MNTESITPRSFNLDILEYGKKVINYQDTNILRFKERSQKIIQDHIEKFSAQNGVIEIKNITIQLYTY